LITLGRRETENRNRFCNLLQCSPNIEQMLMQANHNNINHD
jgi:hypothetical protein